MAFLMLYVILEADMLTISGLNNFYYLLIFS